MLKIGKNIEKSFLVGLPILIIVTIVLYLLGRLSPPIIFLISAAIVALLIPVLWLKYVSFEHIRKVEEIYPNFLRDLTQAIASGMTLPQAINTLAQAEYGELTPYIKKLSASLSWATPFPEAWLQFTSEFKQSELITRTNSIIFESFFSGGEIVSVLNSLAEDIDKIKKLESDKRAAMFQHIAVMYVVFFVFLGIIVMLHKILLPILYIQRFGVFAGMAFRPAEQLSLDYFKNLFFLMAIVQAASLGTIAGQLAEEKLIAGLKHVVIMLGITFVVFGLTILPTKLSFEVEISPQIVGIGQSVTISGQAYYEGVPLGGAQIQIIGPKGEMLSLVTDSLGQFSTTIIAPTQPGEYGISITLTHELETKSVTKKIVVS
ncbi:MAG: type II secretion system F family protein [Candidatus Nanoarchaeia archaeon]